MQSADQLIAAMSVELGMLPRHLRDIIRTAPLRYKTFQIRKRNGALRDVAQPAREVKAIQRWLVDQLRPILPLHDCATAYRRGASIKENARRHLGSRYALKLDFSNFFPSISFEDITRHLAVYAPLHFDPSAARLIAYCCVWAKNRERPLRLCIGAPSSPLLSNSLMFSFDEQLTARATLDGVAYSRYADDITLSSLEHRILGSYPEFVSNTLHALVYPRLSLNEAKTVFISKAVKRVVTGICLTPDDQLSIGRERKREIRAMYHHQQTGRLAPEDIQRLNGLLAFAEDVEPGFVNRLRSKKDTTADE